MRAGAYTPRNENQEVEVEDQAPSLGTPPRENGNSLDQPPEDRAHFSQFDVEDNQYYDSKDQGVRKQDRRTFAGQGYGEHAVDDPD